jgi:hypothetical protein
MGKSKSAQLTPASRLFYRQINSDRIFLAKVHVGRRDPAGESDCAGCSGDAGRTVFSLESAAIPLARPTSADIIIGNRFLRRGWQPSFPL